MFEELADFVDYAEAFRSEHPEGYMIVVAIGLALMWKGAKSLYGRVTRPSANTGLNVNPIMSALEAGSGIWQLVMPDDVYNKYTRIETKDGSDKGSGHGGIAIAPWTGKVYANGTNITQNISKRDRKRIFKVAAVLCKKLHKDWLEAEAHLRRESAANNLYFALQSIGRSTARKVEPLHAYKEDEVEDPITKFAPVKFVSAKNEARVRPMSLADFLGLPAHSPSAEPGPTGFIS